MPRINSSFTARIRNPGGATLLEYLVRRFTYHTLEAWSDLLAKGRLQLEGADAHGHEPLREGQSLRFAVVDYDEPDVPVDFRIVERSGDICLVHKPAGMPVHRTGKIFFQTLANMVREHLGDTAWAPMNRLDRETSGLVAFARGPEAFRDNAPASPDAVWIKFYAAVTRGRPPLQSGSIDLPLGETGLGPIRCKMDILEAETAGKTGKAAQTLYRVLAADSDHALVLLAPITGRKHQLRAHLAGIGCPILGDKIYSQDGRAYLKQLDAELDDRDYAELGARRHLLHAFHLRLEKRPEASDRASVEAWDWDFGEGFAQHFAPDLIRNWCDGEGFSELASAARAAREAKPTAS